jgi:hypothetical protein
MVIYPLDTSGMGLEDLFERTVLIAHARRNNQL